MGSGVFTIDCQTIAPILRIPRNTRTQIRTIRIRADLRTTTIQFAFVRINTLRPHRSPTLRTVTFRPGRCHHASMPASHPQTLQTTIRTKIPFITTIRTIRITIAEQSQRFTIQRRIAWGLIPWACDVLFAMRCLFVGTIAAIEFAVAYPCGGDALLGERATELFDAAFAVIVVAVDFVAAVLAIAVGIATPMQWDAGAVVATELGAGAFLCKKNSNIVLQFSFFLFFY